MSTASTAARGTTRLLRSVPCPYCWERFAPEEILWISVHAELMGDPLLGPETPGRFLPSRFTVDGNAIDARGQVCHQLACPRCRLVVPRDLVELEPLFLSVIGAPSSGKSFFLTSATMELRKALPRHFGISFADSDPAINHALTQYEEALFLNPDARRLIPLAQLIEKTQLQGDLYSTVAYGQHTVSYVRPYLFSMRGLENPDAARRGGVADRLLCLYDNAGEHFQPGQDNANAPVTRHLAVSRAVLFLFDPTQDPRFREACGDAGIDLGDGDRARLGRQELILHEAAARIRKYASQGEAGDRLLIVVVSKLDAWDGLLDDPPDDDPWGSVNTPNGVVRGLIADRIERQSANLRELLSGLCPEIVGAADGFAKEVAFIPASALGDATRIDPASGKPAIRPAEIAPRWAAVPFLYAFHRKLPGLIPRLKEKGR
ncbi:MAG: hypothetical protein U0800_06930 [Isosphaeraceae bacterium]